MTLNSMYLNDVAGSPGGGEFQLFDLARGLRAAGVNIEVACMPGSPVEARLRELGIETHALPGLRPNPLSAVSPLRRLCRERQVDLLHTSSWLTNISGRLAGRLTGIPVVTTVHCEPDSYLLAGTGTKRRLMYGLRDFVDRHTMKYTTNFIAVSRAVADKTVERGFDPRFIEVIYNGIDAASVRAAACESMTLEIPERGNFKIGAMARLDPVKGLDTFIRAVQILNQRGCRVSAYIIGDGPDRSRLERLSAELGLGDTLTFTGHVDNPYPLLGALDLYVLSSKSEGQGRVILDAMALGCPVVATAVGGVVDMVKDEDSGLLVAPGEPAALAEAIDRLAADPDLRTRVVKGGKAVVKNFTIDEMVARTIKVYERTLSAS